MDSDDEGSTSEKNPWYKFGSLYLKNGKIFKAIPLLSLGAALAEYLIIFGTTGFQSLNVVALSAVTFVVFTAFSTLLYIRFDKLTILAFLMCSMSILSSSTFLIVAIQDLNRSSLQPNEIATTTPNYAYSDEFMPHENTHHDYEDNFHNSMVTEHPFFQGRSNPLLKAKLLRLIHTGTHLRWIYVTQFKNKCCGYNNYTDWIAVEATQDKTYNWIASCCDRNFTSTGYHVCGGVSPYGNPMDAAPFVFQQGCGLLLESKLKNVELDTLKTSCALIFWDALMLIDMLAYTIWRKLRSPPSQVCNGQTGSCAPDDDEVFT